MVAGLSSEERAAIEAGFSSGRVHTLFCTSTLAAGVNLPARRCIIRQGTQSAAVKRAAYLQMIGRAGRAGKCPVGESFLVCEWREDKPDLNAKAVQAALCLLAAPMPQLKSTLMPKGWEVASAEQRRCPPCPCHPHFVVPVMAGSMPCSWLC